MVRKGSRVQIPKMAPRAGMTEWPIVPDCKSGGLCLRGFESLSLHHRKEDYMSNKKLLVILAITILIVSLGLYIRQTYEHRQSCITYYDKTGSKALFTDCKTVNKL